jgi:hypothetical protein
MGRRVAEDEAWDDDQWPPGENDEETDGAPTIPCPYCRREIFEDSPQCPHCGQYISAEDSPLARKPWWLIIGVLLCLAAIWVWLTSQ